jgi:hypothetical protein
MDLKGIISISGKPGLFKVIAQNKNNVIVESLIDNKKFPAYASDRISALDDISVYTTDEDLPLKDVLSKLLIQEGGKKGLSHKEDPVKLRDNIMNIVPNLDIDRVYPSDVKKIFQWYNLLLDNELIQLEVIDESGTTPKDNAVKEELNEEKTKAKKAATTKKPTAKVAAKDKVISKTSAPKKAAAVKTGSTRGK